MEGAEIMIEPTRIHKFRLTTEYLIKKIGKFLERGHVYRLQFPVKQNSKLKE